MKSNIFQITRDATLASTMSFDNFNFSQPTNKLELHRFLRLCMSNQNNIMNCPAISSPLRSLIKSKSMIWNDIHQKSFELIKFQLENAPFVQYERKTFYLSVYISDREYTVFLSQLNEGTKIRRIVKKFCERELYESRYVKKLIAITASIKQFGHIYYGHTVVLRIRNPVGFLEQTQPSPKAARMILIMESVISRIEAI